MLLLLLLQWAMARSRKDDDTAAFFGIEKIYVYEEVVVEKGKQG